MSYWQIVRRTLKDGELRDEPIGVASQHLTPLLIYLEGREDLRCTNDRDDLGVLESAWQTASGDVFAVVEVS